MKILVNTSSIGPPLTGIGRYTLHLLQALIQHPEVHEVVGLTSTGLVSQKTLQRLLQQWDQRESHATQGARAKRSLRTRVAALPGARTLWRKLRHFQTWHNSSQLQGFVYWEPNYLLTPFDGPSVATIHDMSHLCLPEHHPAARVAEMNKHMPQTLAQATRLIAVSHFTRDEIQRYLQPTQPIDIVSPAVDRSFLEVTPAERKEAQQHYHLPENYILSVATLEPRKNLSRLVEAYAALPDALRHRYPLVLAGSRGWHTSSLEALIRPLVESGQIRVLGYVDQAHMPALYANATLMAYVSLYEGFGMPIAEAMASGTPVLTASTSAMPEVAAGHALLANPTSTQAIREQLERLLTDPPLRQQLAQSAGQHACTFNWSKSAERLICSLRAAEQDYHR